MSNRTISGHDNPDPWMIAANGLFYLTFTLGNRVEVWSSPQMEDFHNCKRSVVWQPPPNSPWSADIWAPELHQLGPRWYVYFCAAQPGKGNPSHRALLLRCEGHDPMDASRWTFAGPIQGIPDHWNIDATVFTLTGNDLYCCYSGWPLGDDSDSQQDLFLIKMSDPEHAVPHTLVTISRPELPWERVDGGRRGVNEGPTFVDIPGFRGIIYSASGSWTNEYKLGVLALVGNDPLRADSWKKRDTPFMVSKNQAPFGPGHASFVKNPDDLSQVYCIYHATERPDEGWENRKARVVCVHRNDFEPSAPTLCCSAMGEPNPTGPPAPQPGGGHGQGHQSILDKVKDGLREL